MKKGNHKCSECMHIISNYCRAYQANLIFLNTEYCKRFKLREMKVLHPE